MHCVSAGFHPQPFWQSSVAMKSRVYPGVHRPTSRCVRPQFVSPGPRRLENLAAVFLDTLNPEELLRFCAGLERYEEWPVGTICSGSESPLLAFNGFAAALARKTSVRFDVQHRFSCEICEEKRKWIAALFPGSLIFNDAMELPNGEAHTHEGDMKAVPDDWRTLVAGFPCTSVSLQNSSNSSVEARNCIANGSLATGSVFAVIKAMAARQLERCERSIRSGRLVFLLLENVVNLAVKSKGQLKSNLEALDAAMEEAGFVVLAFHLSPLDFGVPASRPRLWMPVVPRIALELAGYSNVGHFKVDMHNLMERLVGFEVAPIDEYLLPDESPLISEYLQQCTVKREVKEGNVLEAVLSAGGIITPAVSGKRRSMTAASSGRALKWHKKHEKAYNDSGRCWLLANRFSLHQLEAFPGLSVLCDRQVEALDLAGVVSYPEAVARTVELKHNLDRVRPSSDIASCVLPGASMYLTHKCRLMHPSEALSLQGIDVDEHLVRQFSGSVLQSLAGNAFETSCCLATFFCTMVTLSPRCTPTILQLPPAGQDVPDPDSSSDESLFVARSRRRRLC